MFVYGQSLKGKVLNLKTNNFLLQIKQVQKSFIILATFHGGIVLPVANPVWLSHLKRTHHKAERRMHSHNNVDFFWLHKPVFFYYIRFQNSMSNYSS